MSLGERVRLAGQHEPAARSFLSSAKLRSMRTCPSSSWRGRCRTRPRCRRTAPRARPRRRSRGCSAAHCDTRARAAGRRARSRCGHARVSGLRLVQHAPRQRSPVARCRSARCGCASGHIRPRAGRPQPHRSSERAADERVIDARGRHQLPQKLAELGAVEHAAIERRIGTLVREHVMQRHTRHVSVLQVIDLLLEHRRAQLPVAVDEREPAARLARQHASS